MARAPVSRAKKNEGASPTAAAENPAVAEKVVVDGAANTGGETAENAASHEAEPPAAAARKEEAGKDGLPFKVNPDGTVNVWSARRAGKRVTGCTGEVVTFDEKGFAVVRLEDALHFQKVPGFSFTE